MEDIVGQTNKLNKPERKQRKHKGHFFRFEPEDAEEDLLEILGN